MRPGVKSWWRSLSREQKISVSVLSTCAVITLFLAVGYVRAQVASPFRVSKTLVQQSTLFFEQQNAEEKQLAESKSKDTDRDGLSDYNEINIYETSAYLPDSDSDGIPDMIEVVQGTNPNCPEGKQCIDPLELASITATSTVGSEFLDVTAIPSSMSATMMGSSSSTVQRVQEFLQAPPKPESMTPTQIRTYLVQHNLTTADALASLPDDQILKIYQAAYDEAIRIQEAQANPWTTTQSDAIAVPVEE